MTRFSRLLVGRYLAHSLLGFSLNRGRHLLAAVERLDLEGMVAKRLRDLYTPDVVCGRFGAVPTRR
jgi:hypothetical protein